MRIFSVADRSKRRRRRARSGATAQPDIDYLEFSPDARLLVVRCEAGRIGPWDVQRGELAFPGHEPEFMFDTRSMFHPSGNWLVGTSNGGGLAVYDLETKQTAHPASESNTEIRRICLTPDGANLICSEFTPPAVRVVTGRTWDSKALVLPVWTIHAWPAIDNIAWSWCCDLTALADGARFATAEVAIGQGQRVSIRSVQTGEVLLSRQLNGTAGPDLAVAPGDALFVARMTRHLHIWATFDPAEQPRVVTNDGRKHFTAIAFHPSGKYLAATSNDETVKFYDVATWTVAKVYRWEIGRMRSIAFSRDGMLAAAGGDRGEVVVWDLDL
jgi:WD40 repeat protein